MGITTRRTPRSQLAVTLSLSMPGASPSSRMNYPWGRSAVNHFASAVADWTLTARTVSSWPPTQLDGLRVDAWQVRLRNVLVALSGQIDRHRARIHLLKDAQVRT